MLFPRVAALCVAAFIAPAVAAAQPVKLAPHRAVYELSLAKSAGGGGGGSVTRAVDAARGRIVFEFTGDACEGYALKYRQVTVLESGESGTRTSDLRNATFEEGDGSGFRFKVDSQLNGASRGNVDGEAGRREAEVQVRLKQPRPSTASLSRDVLFPTAHLKRMIELARAGERTLAVQVYDGSDDGRKVYDTLAVIGRKVEPGDGAELEKAAQDAALARLPRWPVTLSYYAPGSGERTPIYVINFDLYENGVSRALRLDYGDFALSGVLQNLDILPDSTCQR